MRFKVCFIFVLVLFVFLTNLEAAEVKIGYADVLKIFDEYNKTKDQDRILEAESEQKLGKREALVKHVRKMKDELDLLSAEAKGKKQTQIDNKIAELQRFDREIALEMQEKKDRVVREILKEINGAIDKYAEKNGFTIVLNSRALLYKTKRYDLTDKILQILNSGYKK